MQTIKFHVSGANIEPVSARTPIKLFPGMTEPVRLEFTFSAEWEKRVKVAAFWSMMGNEYPPQPLQDGKSCIVPVEALQKAAFKVQILGKANGEKASTNRYTIYLKGGKV